TYDVTVDVVRIHSALRAEQAAETGRIERGPRAKHPPGIRSTLGCNSGGEVCHYVDRVRCDDEDGFRRTCEDLRHRFTEHGGVSLQQVQASLTSFLTHTGTKKDHAAPREVLVDPRTDFQRMRERDCVSDVVSLGLCPRRRLVHQD